MFYKLLTPLSTDNAGLRRGAVPGPPRGLRSDGRAPFDQDSVGHAVVYGVLTTIRVWSHTWDHLASRRPGCFRLRPREERPEDCGGLTYEIRQGVQN